MNREANIFPVHACLTLCIALTAILKLEQIGSTIQMQTLTLVSKCELKR